MTTGTRRPWRVHVHSIGPNYAYSTEAKAVARATELMRVERYSAISVYTLADPFGRTVYRYSDTEADGYTVHVERLTGSESYGWRWEAVPANRG